MNTILTEDEHLKVLDVIGTINLIGDLISQQPGETLNISADNLASLVTTLSTPLRAMLDAAAERAEQGRRQPVLVGLNAFDLSFLMQACIEGRCSVGRQWVDRLTRQFDVAVSVNPDMSVAAQQWARLLAADAAAPAPAPAPAPSAVPRRDGAPARRTRRTAAAAAAASASA